MPRCVTLLAVLLLGCQAPAPDADKPVLAAPAKPGPPAENSAEASPVAAPAAAVPRAVAADPADPSAPPPIAGVRDKHPIGGMAECLEMYTTCTPDGKGGLRCSSERFTLACGATGKVPGGDVLRCVCP